MIKNGTLVSSRQRWHCHHHPHHRIVTHSLRKAGKIVLFVGILYTLSHFLVLWLWMPLPKGSLLASTTPYRSTVRGSASPTVALLMDANHFPYPYLVNVSDSSSTNNILQTESSSSRSAPLVVQCRGEMGNHLSAIAHGIGIQLWALQEFNLSTHMFLRHQTSTKSNTTKSRGQLGKFLDNPKWIRTNKVLKTCFPALKDWEFSLGSLWTDFDRQWSIQQQRYHDSNYQEQHELFERSSLVNGRIMIGRSENDDVKEPITTQDMHDGVGAYAQLWHSEQKNNEKSVPSPSLLPVPFLYSDSLDDMVLLYRYLPVFRQLFRIDPSCCGPARPDPDESVFVSTSHPCHDRCMGQERLSTKQ